MQSEVIPELAESPFVVGRYVLFAPLARGGMATVYWGRQLGLPGTARIVAIKRLHPHLAGDPEFVSMFMDEARMGARVRHPNVVSMLDVTEHNGELLLVMDYIRGESLARVAGFAPPAGLEGRRSPLPLRIVSSIMIDVLCGLQATHSATNELNVPLDLVHRDISPQNIMVGADGVVRIIDFGIAKAIGRLSITRDLFMKGKVAYMAPEQLRAEPVSSRSDVYSASVVLWECLVGRALITERDLAAVEQVLLGDFDPPSRWTCDLPPGVDDVVMKGLALNPADRFASASEMALALESVSPRSSVFEMCRWIQDRAGPSLVRQIATVAAIERLPGELSSMLPATALSGESRGSRHLQAKIAAAAIAILCVTVGARAGRRAAPLLPQSSVSTSSSPHTSTEPATRLRIGKDRTTSSITEPSNGKHFAPSSSAPVTRDVLHRFRTPARAVIRSSEEADAAKTMGSCRVPYEVDEEGHRHYTRSCLR